MDVEIAGIVARLGGTQLVFGVGWVAAGGAFVVNQSGIIILESVGFLRRSKIFIAFGAAAPAKRQQPPTVTRTLNDAKVFLRRLC